MACYYNIKPSSLLPNCIWFGHNVTSNALFQEPTKRRLKLNFHSRGTHTHGTCTQRTVTYADARVHAARTQQKYN